MGIYAKRKNQESAQCEKAAIFKPRIGASGETKQADTLILNL
jgi:hypothetical protein